MITAERDGSVQPLDNNVRDGAATGLESHDGPPKRPHRDLSDLRSRGCPKLSSALVFG